MFWPVFRTESPRNLAHSSHAEFEIEVFQAPNGRPYIRNVNAVFALLGAPHISSLWEFLKAPHSNGMPGALTSSDLKGQGHPLWRGGEGLNLV